MGMLRMPAADPLLLRRRWAGFGALFLLAPGVAALSVLSSDGNGVALLAGAAGAIPTAFLTFHALSLVSASQAAREVRSARFFLETIILGALVAIVFTLVPRIGSLW